MASYKSAYDRWVTSGPPDDGFDYWAELVIDGFTNEFFDTYEDWIIEDFGVCNKWLNKLSDKGVEAPIATAIIERGFFMYKLNKSYEQ